MNGEFEQFASFLKKQTIFPSTAALKIAEISEGNINHIYRATDRATGKSVILKQALEVSRISPDIRLNPDRGKREAAYFNYFAPLLPDALPKIYVYDEDLHLIVMQDLKDCPVLRRVMLAGKPVEHLGAKLGAFVAKTTLATSDFSLGHQEKKRMQTAFSNPELCDLTEKLVLTDPFVGAKDNGVCAENEAYVKQNIYQNESLRASAAALKFRFMNASEALIHGDLHFGSVFVRGEDPVIFDSEFCFFGPIGFDLGNALAHFIIEYLYVRLARPEDALFLAWLREMARELLFTFEEQFVAGAKSCCGDAVLSSPTFIESFVSSVICDTAGYAGAECLRRTIGIAKIPEFTLLSSAQRAKFEQQVMDAGVLLMERAQKANSAQTLACLIEDHFFS